MFNTGFDETILTFTGENGRPLEIEDKDNLMVLINKLKSHAVRAQQCDDI